MSASRPRRSAARRAGESAFGALLLARLVVSWLLAVALVAGGAWASWEDARYTFGVRDIEESEITLLRCEPEGCAGVSTVSGDMVVLEQRFGRAEGERLTVVRPPEGDVVLRSDGAGRLYSLAPLAGGLLLASVVIAGGLRRYRVAWTVAGVALAQLLLTYLLWI
ncbi:hypothetical protein [Streptomyces sedi]|uniref:Uncharacterized protein n=1 Tax=Streptomyces sedi TaxID=555059 RepID=A0A5C4USV8_9ACTN|nr:hypothetical protein [Streptomyces sedi]TNM26618.1 hypothetical protein FH715_22950 [Streptomyces sedi]